MNEVSPKIEEAAKKNLFPADQAKYRFEICAATHFTNCHNNKSESAKRRTRVSMMHSSKIALRALLAVLFPLCDVIPSPQICSASRASPTSSGGYYVKLLELPTICPLADFCLPWKPKWEYGE